MMYIWCDELRFRSAAHKIIDGFANLADGWHYGSGVAPTAAIRRLAEVAAEKMQMLGLPATHVSAGSDGEILLAATSGDDYVSVTVEADETFTFNRERAGTEVEYAEGIELDGLIRRLTSAAEAVWNISDLSIRGLSIANDASSTTWLSRSQSTAACHFLKLNAPQQRVA
jgi:hypothetical protein